MKGSILLFSNYNETEPGDVVFVSDPTKFFQYIKKRKDIDPEGFIDIVAHGTSNSIAILINGKKTLIDWRLLSKIMKNKTDGGYHKIRLLSCNTGSTSDGFAQNLANKLNVAVAAPNNIFWAYINGEHVIAPRMSQDPNNPLFNKPNLKNKGEFVMFYPGGNKKWKK